MNKNIKNTLITCALVGICATMCAVEHQQSKQQSSLFSAVKSGCSAIGTFCKGKACLFNPVYTKNIVHQWGIVPAAKWGVPTILAGAWLARQGKSGLQTRSHFDRVHTSALALSYIPALPVITQQLSKFPVVQRFSMRPMIQKMMNSKPWKCACGPVGQTAWGIACALEWVRVAYQYGPQLKESFKNFEITDESIQETLATTF